MDVLSNFTSAALCFGPFAAISAYDMTRVEFYGVELGAKKKCLLRGKELKQRWIMIEV